MRAHPVRFVALSALSLFVLGLIPLAFGDPLGRTLVVATLFGLVGLALAVIIWAQDKKSN